MHVDEFLSQTLVDFAFFGDDLLCAAAPRPSRSVDSEENVATVRALSTCSRHHSSSMRDWIVAISSSRCSRHRVQIQTSPQQCSVSSDAQKSHPYHLSAPDEFTSVSSVFSMLSAPAISYGGFRGLIILDHSAGPWQRGAVASFRIRCHYDSGVASKRSSVKLRCAFISLGDAGRFHAPHRLVNCSGMKPDIQRTTTRSRRFVVFGSAAAALASWPTGTTGCPAVPADAEASAGPDEVFTSFPPSWTSTSWPSPQEVTIPRKRG